MSGKKLNTSPEKEAVTGLASRRWIVVAQDALVMPRSQDGSFRLLTRHENGPRTRLHKDKFRIGTINASTMEGKEEEVVGMMKERTLDVLGVCETRMKGEGRKSCLLYTSDAADERSSVDLGGRRIIKKKKIILIPFQ